MHKKGSGLWANGPLGTCCRCCAEAGTGVLFGVPCAVHRPSTIDTRSMVSFHIFTLFRPRFAVCVVMGSDWLITYSNTFSDPLQHFHPIDTDVTKMLASDWLLFIAANQKPAFWCRQCRWGENVGEGLKTCWRGPATNQNAARHRATEPAHHRQPAQKLWVTVVDGR